MTSLPVALAIAAATAAGGCTNSHQATAEPPRLENPTYLRELRKLASDGFSGAVAIVVTPKGTWRGAAGWADASTNRRARPDDRFAIESTTKTFVATVVLQLVGERRLDFHDTVQRWLPGLFPARPRITIRQLLNHSSGIPSDFGFSEAPLVRAKRIAAQGVLFRPGTSSAYSNSDFVLLGLIVEKVTGRPLDQVVTSRIISRLHLRGTSYGTARAQRMTPWLGPVESFGRPVSGDGGIISTLGPRRPGQLRGRRRGRPRRIQGRSLGIEQPRGGRLELRRPTLLRLIPRTTSANRRALTTAVSRSREAKSTGRARAAPSCR